ncbi:MAG: hypothetical protein WDW38_008129 [Sanguina aurantia]
MQGVLRKEAAVVRTCDPGAELSVYMQGFANNFSTIELPLGGGMVRKSESRFEICIPRFALFDIAIQPQVKCDVTTTPGLVNVVSRECSISGSPHVDSYRLNDKFDLHVSVSFSWIEANPATQAAPRIVVTSTAPAPPLLSSHQPTAQVLVDVPSPFNLVPRAIIEPTCNAAMAQSLNLLLSSFVESLSADYAVWAKDAKVRSQGLRALKLRPSQY